MKLGILVVYMVTPENGKLIDLHLEYIDKYTRGDYTIYASINGLLPQFHAKLTDHPRVKICSISATDKTLSEEHSYYLEKLLNAAIEDGATHLVILHVDSFPVTDGWNEFISGQLTEKCVMATTSKNSVPVKPTACLFFTREFYLKYKPAFRFTPSDLQSAGYKRFFKRYPIVSWDSCMAFFLKAYAEDLSWYCLERMDKQGGSAIYGGLIFHLEKAYMSGSVSKKQLSPTQKKVRSLLESVKYAIQPLIPKKLLHNRHTMLLFKINKKLILDSMYAEEREILFEQPEPFINELKNHKG